MESAFPKEILHRSSVFLFLSFCLYKQIQLARQEGGKEEKVVGRGAEETGGEGGRLGRSKEKDSHRSLL